MLALVFVGRGWLPGEPVFAAMAAQSLSAVEIRGAYPLRLGFLLMMLAVLTGAAALGSAAGRWDAAAVAATALVAFNAGLWRHLSPEYGVSLAVPTTFIFLLALGMPGAARSAESVLIGGAIAIAIHVFIWPIRAEHPLRRVVAESWVAAADLFKALADSIDGDAAARDAVLKQEANLRTTLEAGYAALAAVDERAPHQPKLMAMHLAGARLAMRGLSAVAAVENYGLPATAPWTATLRAAVESLGNTARAVALAIISGRPGHQAACDVRLRRAASLLQAVRTDLGSGVGDEALRRQAIQFLQAVEEQLEAVGQALHAITDRAGERAAFPLEVFDLSAWTLQPLAAVLNLRQRIDPAIVRFTVRLGVLLTGAVLFTRLRPEIQHGYWLPLTIVVVSQPDYGATRRRAAERMGGTLVGAALGSALLYLPMSHATAMVAAGAACFGFAFFLRRRYAVAVVFVTLLVVLLTEIRQTATLELTMERFLMTTLGGSVALGASLVFWPAWERRAYPMFLVEAFEANRNYLAAVAKRLIEGGVYGEAEILAKRRAEKANANAFASLTRMISDPESKRAGVERAAVLANGNQRLIRALNALVLNVRPADESVKPLIAACAAWGDESLSRLAAAVREEGFDLEAERPASGPCDDVERFIASRPDLSGLNDPWLAAQFARAGAEITAMLLTAACGDSPSASIDAPIERPVPIETLTRA